MATSAWFDYNGYMANKLAQLQKADSAAGWDMVKLVKAFADAGFVGDKGAEQHFEQYGQYEDVAPNAFFNATEYYRAKAADFYKKDPKAVTDLDAASIQVAIKDSGMSAWSHYEQYGNTEKVNPSNSFDTEAYMNAKLTALNSVKDGKQYTLAEVYAAFKAADLSALEHFMLYGGAGDGEVAQKIENGKMPAEFAVPESKKVNGGGSGQTFYLTKTVDTFVGTAADDTFIAAPDAGAVTLTGGDTLDGGAGRDSLKVYEGAGTFTGVAVKNIETFEINGGLTPLGGATGSLDASLYAGLDTVNFVNVGSKGTGVTLNKLSDGFTVGFAGATSVVTPGTHNFNLNYVNAAAVANLTTTNLSGLVSTVLVGAGLTDINITGNTNAELTNGLSVKADTVKTVEINSTGGNYALAGAKITTVDASASTGNLYLELDMAGSAAAKTVKTGAGDDKVWMNLDQLNKGDIVDLGGGADMLGLTVASGATSVSADQYAVIKAAGAETAGFFIKNNGAATTVIDAGNVGGKNIFLDAHTARGSDAQIITLNDVASSQTVTSELNHGSSSGAKLVITSNEGTLGTLNVISQTKGDTLVIANTSEYGTLNLSGAGDVTVVADDSSVKIDGKVMSGTLKATGSTAKDFITGGTGDDTIVGMGGLDTLTGGAGKDMFDLSGVSGGTAVTGTLEQMATIMDFTKGDDTIKLNDTTKTGAVAIDSATFANDTAFNDKLEALLEAGTVAVTVIQYGGATYVVNNTDTATNAPVEGDQIIKLDGLLDLTGASITDDVLAWA